MGSRLVVVLVIAASWFAAPQAHGRELSAPHVIPMQLLRRNDTNTVVAGGHNDDYAQCYLQVEVKTGDRFRARTDSKITFKFADKDGVGTAGLVIDGDNIGIFERGNLDTFTSSDLHPCIFRPCKLTIESDGWGLTPDWFCDYVKATLIEVRQFLVYEIEFTVEYWIGPRIGRKSVTIDNCGNQASSMAVASS